MLLILTVILLALALSGGLLIHPLLFAVALVAVLMVIGGWSPRPPS